MKVIPEFHDVCHECAPKPLGLTPEEVPLEQLIGRFVKLGFKTNIPEDKGPTMEHVWVKVEEVIGDVLTGKINSNPVVINYELDDQVDFAIGEIEDIFHDGTEDIFLGRTS